MAFHTIPYHEQRRKLVGDVQPATDGIRNMRHLTELTERFSTVKQEIELLEKQVKIKVQEREKLEKTEIPDFMMELGMEQVTLANGYSIDVQPFYYARIPSIDPKKPETIKAREAAFQWLRDNGHGGIIKEEISIIPDERTHILIEEFCKEFSIPYDSSESVHHKTLEAWFKEQIEQGVNIPMETFKGYVGRVAKVKV